MMTNCNTPAEPKPAKREIVQVRGNLTKLHGAGVAEGNNPKFIYIRKSGGMVKVLNPEYVAPKRGIFAGLFGG